MDYIIKWMQIAPLIMLIQVQFEYIISTKRWQFQSRRIELFMRNNEWNMRAYNEL